LNNLVSVEKLGSGTGPTDAEMFTLSRLIRNETVGNCERLGFCVCSVAVRPHLESCLGYDTTVASDLTRADIEQQRMLATPFMTEKRMREVFSCDE